MSPTSSPPTTTTRSSRAGPLAIPSTTCFPACRGRSGQAAPAHRGLPAAVPEPEPAPPPTNRGAPSDQADTSARRHKATVRGGPRGEQHRLLVQRCSLRAGPEPAHRGQVRPGRHLAGMRTPHPAPPHQQPRSIPGVPAAAVGGRRARGNGAPSGDRRQGLPRPLPTGQGGHHVTLVAAAHQAFLTLRPLGPRQRSETSHWIMAVARIPPSSASMFSAWSRWP